MYKVLLVDDEYMVTEGLKRLIPFDKWDMGLSQQPVMPMKL
ncbi:response regulator [Streptococcus pneumoniae]|nr:response regulator [Streptococcus pneumoniae]